MSLRDSYYGGPNGLQQQMDAAFANGIAYVGAGSNDISTLDLGDRNGSNLGAGAAQPGKYFSYATPTANYFMWFIVSGEVAPSVSGTLVPVAILSGDSSTQVAAKIATAMNAIMNTPFSVVSSASVVTMNNSLAGAVILPVSAGTLGGTAAVAQAQAGVNTTGNYNTLAAGIQSAAQSGLLDFRVVVQGTGNQNSVNLRNRNGNNLALRAFFAGIYQAMAEQQIYDYQVRLELDISTSQSTNVIFNFHFGNICSHAPVNLNSLICPPNGNGTSTGPGSSGTRCC